MQKSESIKNIAAALMTFHLKVGKISRDANNPFFKKSYASLSNILENIDIPLNESGLVYTQFPDGENDLTTLLMHADSGEWLMGSYTMTPVKGDPQSKGSAITYQRRYALSAVLGLNIEDDDDGNGASGKDINKKEPQKADQSSNELPWLNEGSKEFKGAVEKMKAGSSSIAALKKFFRISKETESKLLEQSKK